ncbi:MAG: hypothetical protein ACYC99_08380 [Candidatus Geothermincolia bacterium]
MPARPEDPTVRRGPSRAPRIPTPTVVALLMLLVWAALGGVLRNGFVNYDDDLYLTANPFVAGGLDRTSLEWAFTTTRGGNWHPATWISHLIDVQLFGLDPLAHHATGLALHAANTVLLLSAQS